LMICKRKNLNSPCSQRTSTQDSNRSGAKQVKSTPGARRTDLGVEDLAKGPEGGLEIALAGGPGEAADEAAVLDTLRRRHGSHQPEAARKEPASRAGARFILERDAVAVGDRRHGFGWDTQPVKPPCAPF
jgi:hypothetical protein